MKENIQKFLCYSRLRKNYDEIDDEQKQLIKEEVKQHFKRRKIIDKRELLRTVLFMDEANTSEAIGLIKEIMIDGTINGKSCNFALYGMDVIAACNPYRKYDIMIIIVILSIFTFSNA